MKQFVLAILLAAGIAGASAAPVSKERAATTATDYAKVFTGHDVSVKEILTVKDAYYIVNLNPQGWVIVSADDNADPIIGIGEKGDFQLYGMPDNVEFFLNAVGSNIKQVAKTGTPRTQEWARVATNILSRSEDGNIDPLIQVNWDQTSPFNKYCPGSGSNQAIVGCVAVAMSQAMSVQKWPRRPTGSVTYGSSKYGALSIDFDAEAPYDWDAMLAGKNSHDEAARLLYHAGMSVEMGYGPDASGVSTARLNIISNALKKHFDYGEDIKLIKIGSLGGNSTNPNYEAWERLIYNELAAGRAVVYNAQSYGTNATHAGHSFNVDGYKNGLFHVNWGWRGQYNNYYNLNALNMSMGNVTYNYNYDQSVIIGIGSPEKILRSIEVNYTKIDEGLDPGAVVGLITVNGTDPVAGCTFAVRGAYNGIEFPTVPFEVVKNEYGYCLTTTEQLSTSTSASYDIEIVARASGDVLTSGFNIKVLKNQPISVATSIKYNRLTEEFTVFTKHGVSYTLLSSDGSTILSGKMAPLPSCTFSRTCLGKGKNVLILSTPSEEKRLEIIN